MSVEPNVSEKWGCDLEKDVDSVAEGYRMSLCRASAFDQVTAAGKTRREWAKPSFGEPLLLIIVLGCRSVGEQYDRPVEKRGVRSTPLSAGQQILSSIGRERTKRLTLLTTSSTCFAPQTEPLTKN